MEYLQTMWSYVLNMQLTDILDIVIVAFLIYKIIPVFRSTGTMRIARVVAVILVIIGLKILLEHLGVIA